MVNSQGAKSSIDLEPTYALLISTYDFACRCNPEPWEDPKNGSTFGFHTLHHRSKRVQNWGSIFWDSPRALASGGTFDWGPAGLTQALPRADDLGQEMVKWPLTRLLLEVLQRPKYPDPWKDLLLP